MMAATGATSKSRSSAKSAKGKARQRARNKNATRSGSSGEAKSLSDMPKRLWAEVEDEVEHVCDIAGKFSHSQVGSSGYLVSTLNAPLEYAHDLLDAHLKARDGLVYIRIYHVPVSAYLGDIGLGEDDESAAED